MCGQIQHCDPEKPTPPMGQIDTQCENSNNPWCKTSYLVTSFTHTRVLFLTHVSLIMVVFQFLFCGLIFGTSCEAPKVLKQKH